MGVENKFERSLRAAADEVCVSHGRKGYTGEIVLRRLQNGNASGWSCDLPLRLSAQLERTPEEMAASLVQSLAGANFLWRVTASKDGQILLTTGAAQSDELGERIRAIVTNREAGPTKVVLELGPPRGSLRLGQVCLALFADTLAQMLRAVGNDVSLELRVDDDPVHLENLGRSLKTRYLKELGYCSLMPEGAIMDGFLVFVAREMKKKIGHTLSTEYSSKPFTAFAVDRIMEQWRSELESIGIVEFNFLRESAALEAGNDWQGRIVHVYRNNGSRQFMQTSANVEELPLEFHPVHRGNRQLDMMDSRGDILTLSQALKELGPDGLREFALDHVRLS